MSSPEGSAENEFMEELTAQVEAVNLLAQEITGLNKKPDELQAGGVDLKSLPGRYAVCQVVEMSSAVTEKLGGMVAEIDYDTIAAAPQDLRDERALWEASKEAVADEVRQAGIKQEQENEQISAILGVPFKAAEKMVQKKMQEREAELQANLPSQEELERLEREIVAADSLFALAGKAWPIPTAHWRLKKPGPNKLPARKLTFTAPMETPTGSDDEASGTAEEEQPTSKSRSPVIPSAFTAPTEPTPPMKLDPRPGRRPGVPAFSSLLSDRNVPGPGTHANIFTFGNDPQTTQDNAAEITPPAAVTASKPVEKTSVEAVPAAALQDQAAEVTATRSVAESVIHSFESSMGTLFLAETLADIVYADKTRPQNADSAIRGHFNHGNGSSHALQERWAAKGFVLQRGKVVFWPGDPHNQNGSRAVHKHVFRLVPAGTKKEREARFEGKVVLWDRTYKFGANYTNPSEQAAESQQAQSGTDN